MFTLTRVCKRIHIFVNATVGGFVLLRLSYTFGMRGPISTSDTACSSSLVALLSCIFQCFMDAPVVSPSKNTGRSFAIKRGVIWFVWYPFLQGYREVPICEWNRISVGKTSKEATQNFLLRFLGTTFVEVLMVTHQ